MATTTNYGWTTPDDTALVKDGASAIRTLGTSVDTTTKNLNPSTTLGDIEYRSSTANTNTRLGIGSTGDVLTVAGGVPSWAAPTKTWTLLNSGGTALTGSDTITISGISNKNNLLIIFSGASSANVTANALLRFNADTGSNYSNAGHNLSSGGSYSANDSTGIASLLTTSVTLCRMASDAASVMNGAVSVDNCNSTSYKTFVSNAGGSAPTSSNNTAKNIRGFYQGTSTISSVSLISSSGNWDAGTIYVYAA